MKADWKNTEGTVAEVQERRTRSTVWYSVVFTYKVDGSWYGGTFWSTDAYQKGDSIDVRYNPADPERNDLAESETRRKWIQAAVVLALVAFWLFMMLR